MRGRQGCESLLRVTKKVVPCCSWVRVMVVGGSGGVGESFLLGRVYGKWIVSFRPCSAAALLLSSSRSSRRLDLHYFHPQAAKWTELQEMENFYHFMSRFLIYPPLLFPLLPGSVSLLANRLMITSLLATITPPIFFMLNLHSDTLMQFDAALEHPLVLLAALSCHRHES